MPFGAPWQLIPHALSQRVLSLPPGFLVVLVVWSLVWKGLALWRAARAGQAAWFIAFLAINTAGLLEMAYLAFLAPRSGPSPAGGRPAVAQPASPSRAVGAEEETGARP
jgi:hypothetical protein